MYEHRVLYTNVIDVRGVAIPFFLRTNGCEVRCHAAGCKLGHEYNVEAHLQMMPKTRAGVVSQVLVVARQPLYPLSVFPGGLS